MIWLNSSNKMYYKVMGGEVYCSRTPNKRDIWLASAWDFLEFMRIVGKPGNFSVYRTDDLISLENK